MGKPYEFWVALVSGVLAVLYQHREKPLVARAVIAAISAGIGYSQAPEVAAYTMRSETLAVMVLTVFGYVVMDFALSLFADREFLKKMIIARMGGK